MDGLTIIGQRGVAAVIGGTAVGVYELVVGAAAALTALFLVTPAGQKAARDAAKATSDALERARKRPDEDPEPKPPKTTVTPCPCNPDGKGPQPCPVCGKGINPVRGFRPAYLDPEPEGRPPQDDEVNPPMRMYRRTGMRMLGATVFQRPDGSYIHRDTLHGGRGAELEVYDKRKKHTGTICPNCGSPRGGPVDGRTLKD
jgi:hypothetical protein